MTATRERPKGFNPAQYEIINMMSCLQDAADYAALKSVLVNFLNARMQAEIDGLYQSGSLSDEKMDALSQMHLRTPYGARV